MTQMDACVAEAHSCVCGSETHLLLRYGIVSVHRGQKVISKHLQQSICLQKQARTSLAHEQN
jgi:hypothetical protein